MQLLKAIPLAAGRSAAFTGSGGKTTAMFGLARSWVAAGNAGVLLSATTHLAVSQTAWADRHIVITDPQQITDLKKEVIEGVVLLTGQVGEGERTKGLPLEWMQAVHTLAQIQGMPLLIEADGSRRKPLKAPAPYEPVVPKWVDEVAVMAGMSGVGQTLTEAWVHRPERFAALSGRAIGEMVTPEDAAKVLASAQGGLQGIPDGARRTLLLNQCDDPTSAGAGKRIADLLKDVYPQVVLASLQQAGEDEVLSVQRRAAGVVLAAGGSARLGQPKQLLDWQGEAFVRAVVHTAQAAGLSPLVVVTGAYRQEVEAALGDLDVVVVHNANWDAGQGGSVARGLEAVLAEDASTPAVLFMLVDQPQTPVALIDALREDYARQLSPVTAPLIDEQRGNPVLFDRQTFEDLLALEGVKGGRQVFAKHRVRYVPWVEGRDGLDVDTWEDYARLLSSYED